MFAAMGFAQKTFDISVTNNSKVERTNAPVVLQLDNYGDGIKSALVTMDGKEIPCQLDDIDGNGTFDELCFLTDIPKKTTKKFCIQLSDSGKPRQYTPKVYVEMMLANKKIKEANKQNLYISQLTVENGVNAYWMIHHHGAAFESDLVA